MKRLLLGLAAIVFALLATGCAHPITIAPEIPSLKPAVALAKIDRKVGLAIPDERLKLEVTTPGGGGDKITSAPYRDLEVGLYVALGEVFSSVTKVASATDPKVAAQGLQLVVTPTINVTTFSPSLVTWPPTIYTVELVCAITDAGNRPVTEVRVQGEGRAEFDEFKGNFGLAGQRASADAVKKLIQALATAGDKLR